MQKKYGDAVIIYAADDEGNSYQKVHFTPTLMYTPDIDERDMEVYDASSKDKPDWCLKVICIN